jgi:hypothetical protein
LRRNGDSQGSFWPHLSIGLMAGLFTFIIAAQA